MANNKIHPITGDQLGAGLTSILSNLNPIALFLAGMFLLAIIIPSRRRKAKRKSKARSRGRKNPGNPLVVGTTLGNPWRKKRGTKSGKPLPRSVGIKSTRSGKPLPRSVGRKKRKPWLVKGSQEARDYMTKIRSMRKK